MKVINLDTLKTHQTVIIDGQEYVVNGMSVDMFINDQDFHRLSDSDGVDSATKTRNVITVIEKLSNIPHDVLMRLQLPVLTALMSVANGIDPTKGKETRADGLPAEDDGTSPNE